MKLKAERNVFQIAQAEKYLSAILPRLAERRVQSFTTLVLSLITLSFFGIFAISPTLSTIADLQKQITDNQFVNQQLKQKIINLSQLQISYRKIQADLPILYAAVPQNPDVTDLVGQIQTLAQNAHVTLLHIQTLPVDVTATTIATYNSFAFSLDVSGSYDTIKTFLSSITTFNRLITIDAIALSKPITATDTYTLSLRGKAYLKTSK